MTQLDFTECAGSARRLPTSIHFLLIDKCNAKCVFCGGDYFRSRSGKSITLEKFKIMAENLHLERFREMMLAGAGDPLLNSDIVPIIKYTHHTYPSCNINITTNGIALTKDLSHQLLEAGAVKFINISINAASQKTYERLMQVNRFETVLENVRHFNRIKQNVKASTFLQFSMALSRVNIDELMPLVNWAHKLGVPAVNTFYCRFYPNSIRNLNIESGSLSLDNQESLFFHQEFSDAKVADALDCARALRVQLTHEPLFSERAKAQPCRWAETSLMVGFDGEVYPCGGGELHFKKKVARNEYNFGNALTQRLEQFWDNADYQAIRISSRRGSRRPVAECGECANLMKQDDVRSHIMQWKEYETHPLVSVIVPTYNRPDMLAEAIKSIQEQTYPNIEIIVINDAGEDVKSVVSKLNSKGRITHIAHTRNLGLAAARNTGIKASKGSYIAYLDDDDIFFRDHVETLVASLEGKNQSVVYTDAYRGFQTFEKNRYVVKMRDIAYSLDFDGQRILCQNFIPVLCIMHRRSCLERVGMFDENLKRNEDWDLWIRMSRRYEFIHIKKVTCEFRCRADGSSMIASSMAPFAWSVLNMMHKYREIASARPPVEKHRDHLVKKALCDLRNYFMASGDDLPNNNHDKHWFGMSPDAMMKDLDTWSQKYPAESAQVQELIDLMAHRKEGAIQPRVQAKCEEDPSEPDSLPRSSETSSSGRSILSIVIVTYNSAKDIGACLESVRANTVLPYEIIVVDNASQDNTRERLRGLQLEKLILNPANNGFSKGCNQGIGLAEGDHIVLLNPDTRVTHRWDERLVHHVGDDIGAVGPLSNYVAGLQKYEHYTDARLSNNFAAEALAENLYSQNGGQGKETKLLIGFCLLIPRKVIEEVGNLDEELFLGNDDLDLSLRIRSKGYKLIVATDAFVFHRGHVSFTSQPSDSSRLLIQQSTDALYRKLVSRFGAWGLPPAMELWGIGWFRPSGEVIRKTRLVSIVILTHNQLDCTRKCIASISAHTAMPFELIVVDNASTDETVHYLENEVKDRYPHIPLTVIRNRENLGYAAGNNSGIQRCRGDYILVMNNDVVVTPKWLERLLDSAMDDAGIGIVGPVTNHVSGPQRVKDIAYRPETLQGLDEFARAFSEKNTGKRSAHWKVVGFCMLIHREVIRQIGGFDPRFGVGNFEDDDFCARAFLAGFKTRIAEDCFVHHFGGMSFKFSPVEYQQILNTNWILFCAKWGIPKQTPLRPSYTLPLQGVRFDHRRHYVPLGAAAGDCHAALMPGCEKSVSMAEAGASAESVQTINVQSLRDGGQLMNPYEKMYENIQPLFKSCRIEDALQALRNVVGAFPEFARAHNELAALYYRSGEKEKALGHFERAVKISPDDADFIKNLADFYYSEQSRTEDAVRLYEHLLQSRPHDVDTLMTTAHILVSLQRFDEAGSYYRKALDIEPWNTEAQGNLRRLPKLGPRENGCTPPEELYAEAQRLAGSGRHSDARLQMERLIEIHPGFAPAYNDLGVLCFESGEKDQALHHYEEAVRLQPANPTFQKNLADFYFVEQGQIEKALKIYVRVLEAHPQDIETLLATAQICVTVSRWDDAKTFYQRVLEIEPWNAEAQRGLDTLESNPPNASLATVLSPKDLYGEASRLVAAGNIPAGRDRLLQLAARHPDFALAQNDLGVLAYQAGEKDKAVDHYQKAVRLDPTQVTFQKNLADCYWIGLNRLEDALKIYVDVLKVHPEDVETLLATGKICLTMRQADDARVFFDRVLEIEPWNAEAQQNLEQIQAAAKAA
jgi:GT2 family glycosyltransferase/tetratricopeptide (TPR) repeat protein/MoaA/NifB/PqqE/SkfB family radical SAM enzyme